MPSSSRAAKRVAKPSGQPKLGALPEWNLGDLYPGMDSAEYQADLARAAADAQAFADAYRGKLAEIAIGPEGGERLAEALQHRVPLTGSACP